MRILVVEPLAPEGLDLLRRHHDVDEKLDLPRAESGSANERPPEELVLNVFRDGRVALGGRELDDAALRASLENAAQRDPATPVTIRGDAHVEHAHIVSVMDACALAGLSNLSVGTLTLAGGG